MTCTRTTRRAAAAAAALAAALVLAACGSDAGSADGGDTSGRPAESAKASASASSAAGAHNAADVAFAQQMIPHHRQAVEMAELADGRAASPEVKGLAQKIKKAQDPEIAAMSAWLESWGEPVPEAIEGMEGMEGMDHSAPDGASEMPGMSGMMDKQQMDGLKKASGAAFDTAFLDLMIEHHEGAVAMARKEREQGKSSPAKKLASSIATSQTAEIEQMRKLLGKG